MNPSDNSGANRRFSVDVIDAPDDYVPSMASTAQDQPRRQHLDTDAFIRSSRRFLARVMSGDGAAVLRPGLPVAMLGGPAIDTGTASDKDQAVTTEVADQVLARLEQILWLTYRCDFTTIARERPTKRDLSPGSSPRSPGSPERQKNGQGSQSPNIAESLLTWTNDNVIDRIRHQLINGNAALDGFTADTGWGCMIRSGQCLLANALSRVWDSQPPEWAAGPERQQRELKLLNLFADDPRAKFGIHEFVAEGQRSSGVSPGQWFGPSATARAICHLNEPSITNMRIYVTGDGGDNEIREDDVLAAAGIDDNGEFGSPLLLLFSTRLGLQSVSPAYWKALCSFFDVSPKVNICAGIAGGRPSSSHFFVGRQDTRFFYLDPHHTRHALPLLPHLLPPPPDSHPSSYYYPQGEEDDDEKKSHILTTSHTRVLRSLDLSEMDPSMLMGLLFESRTKWDDWVSSISDDPVGQGEVVNGKKQRGIFSVRRSNTRGSSDTRESTGNSIGGGSQANAMDTQLFASEVNDRDVEGDLARKLAEVQSLSSSSSSNSLRGSSFGDDGRDGSGQGEREQSQDAS